MLWYFDAFHMFCDVLSVYVSTVLVYWMLVLLPFKDDQVPTLTSSKFSSISNFIYHFKDAVDSIGIFPWVCIVSMLTICNCPTDPDLLNAVRFCLGHCNILRIMVWFCCFLSWFMSFYSIHNNSTELLLIIFYFLYF